MRPVRTVLVFLLAAGLGLAIFGVMVRRAVTLEEMAPADAGHRFEAVRAGFGSAVPLVTLDAGGRPVRTAADSTAATRPAPEHLYVLVYRAREERLARAEVPFWFFKLKGPAVRLALRETDFDLDRLGLTPGELERLGPRLVFEETKPDGDRVLVWTR
jgi:hypothetical protein